MIKLLIIIPAYNEGNMISQVLKSIPRNFAKIDKTDILVIDDGSRDDTALKARIHFTKVIRHLINRGLGASLTTGFKYAIKNCYNYIVTFDADGQHSPADINILLVPLITKQADVVIGSRLLQKNKMPFLRKMINIMSNYLTWLLFRVWTTDSQSGLRAFTREALEKIKIQSQRMEVSSEIFKEISRCRLKVVEVPVSTIYTEYSLYKGQKLDNAPNVFWKLVLQRFT